MLWPLITAHDTSLPATSSAMGHINGALVDSQSTNNPTPRRITLSKPPRSLVEGRDYDVVLHLTRVWSRVSWPLITAQGTPRRLFRTKPPPSAVAKRGQYLGCVGVAASSASTGHIKGKKKKKEPRSGKRHTVRGRFGQNLPRQVEAKFNQSQAIEGGTITTEATKNN